MLPIVFLSFCALAFCLERSWYWLVHFYHAWGRADVLDDFFEPPWKPARAMEVCASTQDPLLKVLRDFLFEYQNVTLEIAENKAHQMAEEITEESRKFLDILALIANISGTLGLLGTVVGISLTFESMAKNDSKGVALSLATALYTTIGGIILFFLSYLFFFFLQKLSNSLESQLDVNIQKLRDLLEVHQKSKLIFAEAQNSSEPEKPPKVLDLKFEESGAVEKESPPAKPTEDAEEFYDEDDEEERQEV